LRAIHSIKIDTIFFLKVPIYPYSKNTQKSPANTICSKGISHLTYPKKH
jgi:hypothetical protein